MYHVCQAISDNFVVLARNCLTRAHTLDYIVMKKNKQYVWVIDQACSVKMAGYWPSSFFCVFMDREEVEVHKHAKKNRPLDGI